MKNGNGKCFLAQTCSKVHVHLNSITTRCLVLFREFNTGNFGIFLLLVRGNLEYYCYKYEASVCTRGMYTLKVLFSEDSNNCC